MPILRPDGEPHRPALEKENQVLRSKLRIRDDLLKLWLRNRKLDLNTRRQLRKHSREVIGLKHPEVRRETLEERNKRLGRDDEPEDLGGASNETT